MGGYKRFLQKNWLFIVIFMIVLVAIAFEPATRWLMGADSISVRECPFAVEGSNDADVTIQYFTSPNCMYCWIEGFSLNKLVEKRGDMFSLEKYDIRYCSNLAREHRIVGTPSFVFKKGNTSKAYFGYRNVESLEKILCGVEKC